MNIIQAMERPGFFDHLFRDQRTWLAWKAFLKALFGLKMSEEELECFRGCTELDTPFDGRMREAWVLVGRRGGKSSIAALIAVWLACYKDWSEYLRPGERPYVFVISVTKFQARIVKDYVLGILESEPDMQRMISVNRQFEIDLTNGVTISCLPCTYRAIRGKTVVCGVLEEVCFWRWEEESAVQDKEVVRALRPSMSNIPESLLIAISTPYVAQGVMAESFNDYYGRRGPSLCWKASTLTMNPTYPKEEIEKEYEKDPESAASEYGAEWRSDISGAIPPEIVDAAIVPNRFELESLGGIDYIGAIDPSGGRRDSFTMGIVHREERKLVVDVMREARPPFRPESVVEEFSDVFKKYRVQEIQSDRYAGEWVTASFRDCGIRVKPAKMTKSEFYLEVMPLLNNGSIELLDSKRLAGQFKALQRRSRSGGKDLIDNFLQGGHDDCANVCAIACVSAAGRGEEEPARAYHLGMGRKPAKEEDKKISESLRRDIKEKALSMIEDRGYASLGILAHSIGYSEEALREQLKKMGFREHKKNRFIRGEGFGREVPAAPKREEYDGDDKVKIYAR